MILARDHPELFREVVHLRVMQKLPLGSRVFDPCQHPEEHFNVCDCPRGCLTWEIERAVHSKLALFHLLDEYEADYLSDRWVSYWQPSSMDAGKYLSPRLLYQLADLYSDVPDTNGCTELWRVLFPYTVNAMMYGTWHFPVMALAAPSRLDQLSICYNLDTALEFVQHHSNYSIELYVAAFLHVWWFRSHMFFGPKTKYVLSQAHWSRRLRMQLRFVKPSRRDGPFFIHGYDHV